MVVWLGAMSLIGLRGVVTRLPCEFGMRDILGLNSDSPPRDAARLERVVAPVPAD
jgi:hypothetical protein